MLLHRLGNPPPIAVIIFNIRVFVLNNRKVSIKWIEISAEGKKTKTREEKMWNKHLWQF